MSAQTRVKFRGVTLSCAGLSRERRNRALRQMKNAGFAAWFRPELPGVWGPHIHAILVGDKELGWLAADQVKKYDAGRDGLAGNHADGSYRPRRRRFSYLLRRPVRR